MEEKLWSRKFISISLVSFLVYLTFYSLLVIITLFAMNDLHASSSHAGLAAGIFLLAALIARIYTGHHISKVGERRTMISGLALFLAIQVLYFFAFDVWVFAAVRFLHGLAFGVCTTSITTLAAKTVPESRRGEGMGYFMLSITFASAVGPFAGLTIYRHFGFAVLTAFCTAALVCGFAVALTIHAPGTINKTAAAEHEAQGLSAYFEGNALPIALISLVIYFCYSGVISFFSTYMKDIGLMSAGSYFFIVYSAAIIISRPALGKLADRKGYGSVMYPSLLMFAAGLILFSMTANALMLFFSAILLGVGFGTFAAMAQVIAIKKAANGRMSVAISTVLAISELGTGFGPYVIGIMLLFAGYRTMYMILAEVAFCCIIAYFACSRRDLV